jgi:hypothetical protein
MAERKVEAGKREADREGGEVACDEGERERERER